ncbi:MAG: hypothetical protein AAB516_00450 [Patescibacteria group bacterium]
MFKKKLILFFIIICFSFLQTVDFSIFGVKPNLALVAVIAAAFFISDIWEGVLLAVIAALILKFSPGFSKEILIFFLIVAAAIIAKKYLPWRSMINLIFLIISATLLFYVFSFPTSIISGIFIQELIYNILIGIFIFIVFSFCVKRYI